MLFDARVEPLDEYVHAVTDGMARAQAREFGRQMDQVVKLLRARFPADGGGMLAYRRRSRRQGTLAGHIKIDRFGVLSDLRDFARECELEQRAVTSETPFAHLLNQGDADGLFLPLAFAEPLRLELRGRGRPYPVGSCVQLKLELEALNERLCVEQTFHDRWRELPQFIEASEDQIERMDITYDLDPSFWARFAYIVLNRLNTLALDHHLPLIFHYAP